MTKITKVNKFLLSMRPKLVFGAFLLGLHFAPVSAQSPRGNPETEWGIPVWASLRDVSLQGSKVSTHKNALVLPADLPKDPACNRASVSINNSREIYFNGRLLGDSARDFKTDCVGDVVWISEASSPEMYKNDARIGSAVSKFDIADYTGDVAWITMDQEMWKNGVRLSMDGAASFVIAPFTGDVAWVTTDSEMYKNDRRLGVDSVSQYKIAGRTGDVAWLTTDMEIWKNDGRLSIDSASLFDINAYTGDVVWISTDRTIYKNDRKIGVDANRFSLYPDGRVSWIDGQGEQHND